MEDYTLDDLKFADATFKKHQKASEKTRSKKDEALMFKARKKVSIIRNKLIEQGTLPPKDKSIPKMFLKRKRKNHPS